jgi:hypothetical protein
MFNARVKRQTGKKRLKSALKKIGYSPTTLCLRLSQKMNAMHFTYRRPRTDARANKVGRNQDKCVKVRTQRDKATAVLFMILVLLLPTGEHAWLKAMSRAEASPGKVSLAGRSWAMALPQETWYTMRGIVQDCFASLFL